MKPIVLTIMDGLGVSNSEYGNAYAQANTENLDNLISKYPNTLLNASGKAVGLPEGQMGNSEVGHLNIGAGRVVYQALELINIEFSEGIVGNNAVFKELVEFAKSNNNRVHLMGLLSDGGVHSHINQFMGLLELLDKEGIEVNTHAFYDGRDVDAKSAKKYVSQYSELATKLGNGHIVTGAGRYYGMDRDTNYDRTQLAYNAIVNAVGVHVDSALYAIDLNYSGGVTDEFIHPYVVNGYKGMVDGDAMLFVNFRPDRAIQISNAIFNEEFDAFETKKLSNTYFATLTKYTRVNSHVMYGAAKIENGLGEYLSKIGKKQLRIAETEKYAHVTFFFDGGVEVDYPNKHKVLVDSPKVATYDLKPEMSAYEVCEKVLEELDKDYDVVILNFANPDMVGHTGDLGATIKAVEAVDKCIGKIYEKVSSLNGAMIITADHGNAEYMKNEDGESVTTHSTNLVPFCITKEDLELRDGAALCDIAPTILYLLGESQPSEMTGKSIIKQEGK